MWYGLFLNETILMMRPGEDDEGEEVLGVEATDDQSKYIPLPKKGFVSFFVFVSPFVIESKNP